MTIIMNHIGDQKKHIELSHPNQIQTTFGNSYDKVFGSSWIVYFQR